MLAASERLVHVVRDGPLTSPVSVHCQSLGGSAVPLVNYVPVYSTQLEFDVGVGWHAVNLATLNDGKPVPDLNFYVVLYATQGTNKYN